MSKKDYYIVALNKSNGDDKLSGLNAMFGNGLDSFYVIVTTRKELSELYSLIDNDNYTVQQIQKTQNPIKTFTEFRKELIDGEDNKPKGLNF